MEMCPKRYFLISVFVFILSHGLLAESADSIVTKEQWLEEMDKVIKEVPVNPDSIRLAGLQLIEGCPCDDVYKRAYLALLNAEVNYYRQHLDLSLSFYNKSLSLFLSADDTSKLAMLYNNIGLLHFYKAEYDSALVAYDKSLSIEIKTKNKEGIAQSYQNIGMIYSNWEQYEQAKEFYKMALDIFYEIGNDLAIADVTNNLAIMAVELKDYDLGLEYYYKSLKAYREIGNETGEATVALNLGGLFKNKGQYSKALKHINLALDIFSRLDNKMDLVYSYSMKASLYLSMDNMPKAIEYYNLAEKYNVTIGLRDVRQSNYKELYEAYKSMGYYKKANNVLEKYYAINDSIFDEDKYARLIEMEKRYHSEKSKKELIAFKAKEERNRMYLFGLSVFFILSAIIVAIWFYVMKIKERQRRIMMEQKVLRTQMNPHFIFNTLSALQYFILENNINEAVDLVADFSGLIRLVLQYAKEELITLTKEKQILERYMSVQNRRFSNKINYSIDFDPGLDADIVLVPPMLTQPFLENAIEHGRLTEGEGGFIKVSLRKIENYLEFSIEDNGVGIKSTLRKSNGKKHKSVALKLTHERLRLINEMNNNSSVGLKMEDMSEHGGQGTRVVFKVPYLEIT